MVGRVLVHATMSLDGFIAGPDDAVDWVFEYVEPSAADDEVIKMTGAMLGGRRSYDVGKRDAGKESGTLRRGLDWTGVRAHPVAARRAPVGSSFDVCRARVRARVDAAGGDDLDVLDSSSLTQTCRLRYSHPRARAASARPSTAPMLAMLLVSGPVAAPVATRTPASASSAATASWSPRARCSGGK